MTEAAPSLPEPEAPEHDAGGTDRAPDTDLETVLFDKPGHLIRRLQQIAVSLFLEECAAFDLTPVQYAALAAIRANPGTDQARLAQAIGFDRTTITGVLDRLQAKGLMRREIVPHDRRANALFLTPAGEQLLRQARPATDRVQGRILDPLTAGEQEQFVEMLARLVWHHNETSRAPITRPKRSAPARHDAPGRDVNDLGT